MRNLICYYPLIRMLRFSKLNGKRWQMLLPSLLSMIIVKAQILSNPEISSFQETFNRILHTKISLPTLPSTQLRSALVGQNIGKSKKQQYRNSGLGSNSRGPSSTEVVYYYYYKLRHVIRDCKKQQNRN